MLSHHESIVHTPPTCGKVEGAQPLDDIFGALWRHLVEDVGAARPVEAEDEPGHGLDGQGRPDRRHQAEVRRPTSTSVQQS